MLGVLRVGAAEGALTVEPGQHGAGAGHVALDHLKLAVILRGAPMPRGDGQGGAIIPLGLVEPAEFFESLSAVEIAGGVGRVGGE